MNISTYNKINYLHLFLIFILIFINQSNNYLSSLINFCNSGKALGNPLLISSSSKKE